MQKMSLKPQLKRIHIKLIAVVVFLRKAPLTQSVVIVHFKRLGSRHFVKEMKIQSILPKYNMIFRKTNLKPKTISELHSKGVKSSRLSNLMRLKVR